VLAAVLLSRIVPRGLSARPAAASSPDRQDELQKEQAKHHRAEEELHLREEWYRNLFRNTKDMILVHPVTEDNLPLNFCEVNDIACAKLEHTRAKLLTMTPMDIEEVTTPGPVPGFSREQLVTLTDEDIAGLKTFATQGQVRQILEKTEADYDRVFVSRSGKKIPVSIHARRIDLLEQPMIMCIARDLTERKEVERLLRESEERSKDFFSHSPIGVALYDAERQLVNVNRACIRMFGSPDSREFGRFNVFDNPFLPAPIKKRLREGETVRYEAMIDFDEARGDGLLVTGRSGQANLDMLITNLGVDTNFNPKGFLVQVQDLTERRKAETALRRSEQQLRQAQKLEAIGTLAGGIAHDFNNILTPILGYTEMCLYSTSEEDEVHGYMQEVMKAVSRAKELVKQILTFSRQMEPEGKPIRIAPIVKEVLTLLRATVPRTVEIRRVIKTEHDIILANPTQIHQVAMNLCTNAVQAMGEAGGVLEVVLTDFILSPRSTTDFPQLNPGPYLRLSVRDTGYGMDKDTADRIFEPFFTTKDVGDGTGMGLAVVHGIVSSLKGGITVESEQGSGTTFHIVLPLMEEIAEKKAAEVEVLPSGSENVLFVDDDIDVATMMARMLRSLGYKPVVAGRGEEALWMFEQDPERFQAVITDHAMPGLTGADLAEKLLGIRPELPVIVCTGYGDKLTPQQAEAIGISAFMTKPVVMRDLAETLRRVIDQAGAKHVNR